MGVARTIAKNSLFNFITTVLNMSAIFVIGIVLARYLGPKQYGVYSLLMWFISLAILVASLGVGLMTKRFVAESVGQQNPRATKGIIQLTLVARSVSSLLVSLLIISLAGPIAKLFGMPANQQYFMLLGFAFFPYMLVLTFSFIFAGFQKYEYSTWLELLVSPFRVGIVIVLVVLGFGIKEIFISYAVVWAAGLLFGLYLTNRFVPIRDLFLPSLLSRAARLDAIKYSIAALGIVVVDYFLWKNAEVMLLGIYRPVEEVGFYNIAYRIPTALITLIPYVFGQVLMPAVSEQFGKGDTAKIKRIYVTSARYLMMLSFPIAGLGIAQAGPIINVLFGMEYAPAIVLMQIVFIPFALRGITDAVSSVIYGIKEPMYLLKIGAILVVISIGLNLLLIPRYGAMGAVIATSIPRVIALPIYIIFVSRKIRTPWPRGDTARIVLASIGMGLIAFALQHYLDSDILSLCLSIPISVIVYIVALLALGAVRKDDLLFLKQLEQRFPLPFRRGFRTIITVVGKFVK